MSQCFSAFRARVRAWLPARSLRLLAASVSLSLLCSVPVAGCGPAEEAAPRIPETAQRTASVARLKGRKFAQLRESVRSKFGEGPFSVGQTLEDSPNSQAIDFTEELPPILVERFREADLANPRSPLIAHEAPTGALRFIQLGQELDKDVSLVAGRESGNDSHPDDRVYRVENRWIRQLIEWDTCARAVASDTARPRACGVDDCPVIISQQRVVHPSGEAEMLQLRISSSHGAEVVAKHDAEHRGMFKGCTVVPPK